MPGEGSQYSIERKLDVLLTDIARSPDAGQEVTLGVAKASGSNTYGYTASNFGTVSTQNITEFDSSGDTLHAIYYRDLSTYVPEVILAFNTSGFAGFDLYKGQMIISNASYESIFLFTEARQITGSHRSFSWTSELVIGDDPRWIEGASGSNVAMRLLREGAARTEELLDEISGNVSDIETVAFEVEGIVQSTSLELSKVQDDIGRTARHDGESRNVVKGTGTNVYGYNQGNYGSMTDRSVTFREGGETYQGLVYSSADSGLHMQFTSSLTRANVAGHRFVIRNSSNETLVLVDEADHSVGTILTWSSGLQYGDPITWLAGLSDGDTFTTHSLYSLAPSSYHDEEIQSTVDTIETKVDTAITDVGTVEAKATRE